MSDSQNNEIGNIEYWATRWTEKRTGWHINEVNPMLVKYLGALTGSPENHGKDILERNSKKKIFVPLCGKTKDLAYLLSLGFQVFAIEGVKQAIQELDEENNFQLSLDEVNSLYSTSDGKLKIFYGDLFKWPVEKWGPFDFIWDRGSLIAMEYCVRMNYIEVMKRCVRDSQGKYLLFRYLLETVEYDRTKFAGPPRVVEETDLKELYSSWAHYEWLERFPLPENHSVRKIPDMDQNCAQSMYLITRKE